MLSNTTSEQDRTIERAANVASTVEDLLDIVRDLDQQLEEWQTSTDCGDAREAKSKIEKLESDLEAANSKLEAANSKLEAAERYADKLETQIVDATV